MEESLSGTLAIDLGNTNTVVAFQDQKDINSVLVEIPNITSSCLLYTSPSPRDGLLSRMPSSA